MRSPAFVAAGIILLGAVAAVLTGHSGLGTVLIAVGVVLVIVGRRPSGPRPPDGTGPGAA